MASESSNLTNFLGGGLIGGGIGAAAAATIATMPITIPLGGLVGGISLGITLMTSQTKSNKDNKTSDVVKVVTAIALVFFMTVALTMLITGAKFSLATCFTLTFGTYTIGTGLIFTLFNKAWSKRTEAAA